MPKSIDEFTDKELADMVRKSIYAKGTTFGEEEVESRFLLVLAVSYGNVDHVDDLAAALEGFRELLTDEDWTDREFQVYDHSAPQHFYAASMEEAGDDGLCGCGRERGDCATSDGADYCCDVDDYERAECPDTFEEMCRRVRPDLLTAEEKEENAGA